MNPISLLKKLLLATGDLGIFAFRAAKESFHPPVEFNETVNQLFEIGARSSPLLIASGFAFGIALAIQTRASMQAFGAESLIPAAVSFGLIKDVGPLVAGLLVTGRVGAGIGAQLAEMRVTSQIDALEALAVDSFKYLVVTRIVACVIALPLLTTLLDFAGLAGGILSEFVAAHMSARLFVNDAFRMMGCAKIPGTGYCRIC